MTQDASFPRFVSLACHDLRTPLATVHGFARTLDRLDSLPERTSRYLEMIAAASAEMAELLDQLSLVARIESGRYDPQRTAVDSLELAESAAQLAGGEVTVRGKGARVHVEREATERGVAAFARCALRHGDDEHLTIEVEGARLRLSPIGESVAPIITGEELRDLGAAAAMRFVAAVGGSVAVDGDALDIEFPATSAAATADGP